MHMFSGSHYMLIGISAMALVGCATPEPTVAADAAPKVAAVKCKRSPEVLTGTLIRRDCSGTSDAKVVNTEDFLNGLQVPGAVRTN